METLHDYIKKAIDTGEKQEIPKDVMQAFSDRVNARIGPKIQEHRRRQRVAVSELRNIILD